MVCFFIFLKIIIIFLYLSIIIIEYGVFESFTHFIPCGHMLTTNMHNFMIE